MAETTSLVNRLDHLISRAFPVRICSKRSSERAFLGVSALLFAASAALTIVSCMSMAAMENMPMPGGWTMSMAWIRMPEQTWLGVAASFVGMWVVMMIAMMLPSLTPVLWRYRQVVGWMGQKRLDYLTTIIAVGYFSVWTVLGIAVFAIGTTLATFEMQRPTIAATVPFVGGLVVLLAGLLQFTRWKARHLACCREPSGNDSALPVHTGRAWREGLQLGVHCSLCCAGLTAALLVSGMMNLGVMALVGAAVTLERLMPASKRVSHVIGAILIVAAFVLIGRTVAAV